MKNYEQLALLCAKYAMALGIEMGSSTGLACGKAMVHVPKKWLRELCDDQLDEDEYIGVKTLVFKTLRAAAERQDWGDVTLHENGDGHFLQFRRTDYCFPGYTRGGTDKLEAGE